MKIHRAILSVSDKTGILGLARVLHKQGVEIFSTGGTGKTLSEAGIPFVPMEKVTGNPEAFGGRMKTISFPFASSLLFRRENEQDVASAKAMGIEPMDLVVCNLYPFDKARQRQASDSELIEEIDVGGPTMIRAAAKNYRSVTVLTSPSQYADFLNEFSQGSIGLDLRKRLAVEAFSLLAEYDGLVAQELSLRFLGEESLNLSLHRGKKLRYGENPHQAAIFYRLPDGGGPSIASAEILQGKQLSYNNLLDADAALRATRDVWSLDAEKCVVSIIKHLNPCGLASAETSVRALQLAWEGDPVSAFGGILCFSHELDIQSARWLEDKFVELLVVPSVAPEALSLLAKKKNLRVLLCSAAKGHLQEKSLRSVLGGLLVQLEDNDFSEELKIVTKKSFPSEHFGLAMFGIRAAKNLRSNAIALVRSHESGHQLVGAGMGQPNRLDCIELLAGPRAKAKGIDLAKLVLVSDAFFPFADGVEAAFAQGIRMIVQPGGSIRDEEVIASADKLGIAMAFTGVRHFRH